ncbi:hypothetical protein MKW94_011308 [Papaver nudicaule]|uniref:Uncharacterized protein n=1 Tax=Papaver nudicaule TaxID=74823 RepID=A0AA42B166_PAPNU|nr:hypothetical protein [Papaver nudicaule]
MSLLDVCSGTWDFTCFIEHLCVSNIVRLLMVLGLCYISKSLCKMCWLTCQTYCYAIQDFTCCLWYKLKNTKRVNRRRRRFCEIEQGYSSSEKRYRSLSMSSKRRWNRGRKTRRRPLYHVKLKSNIVGTE